MNTFTLRPIVISHRDGSQKRYVIPPSLNARIHWTKRREATDQFKNDAFYSAKEAKLPKLPKALITFMIYRAGTPQDYDNAYASMKPIIDGIVLAKVVPDDGPEYVVPRVKMAKVAHKSEERIEITVEEIK